MFEAARQDVNSTWSRELALQGYFEDGELLTGFVAMPDSDRIITASRLNEGALAGACDAHDGNEHMRSIV